MPRVRPSDREFRQLEKTIGLLWDRARSFGLDPFPVNFEIVPASIMYEFGAYGLPGRFSHWTHGKAYHKMKMHYDLGLAKIYELVINTNPCHAFLLETNSPVENKLVVSHVMAHSDFFKNNIYFGRSNRDMVEKASVDAERIRRYEFEHGRDKVERFLDAVLAIQEHVDPFGPDSTLGRGGSVRREVDAPPVRSQDEVTTGGQRGFETSEKSYDDLFLPEERREARRSREETREQPALARREKDLLLFLAENAPRLEEWQRDVIMIVRSEMLYFYPQIQTKIMNEGWATYWHTRLMRELDLADDEYTEFARLNASVQTIDRMHINSYQLGFKMFEDIERRWNHPDRGGDGSERGPGKGVEKIFEVRESENDESFLRNYLSRELIEELDLYIYELKDDQWVVVEKDWEKIRDLLVRDRVNGGYPYITVVDGDYRGNRELFLVHQFDGRKLDVDCARKALEHVHRLWRRKVHLETVIDGKATVISCENGAPDR